MLRSPQYLKQLRCLERSCAAMSSIAPPGLLFPLDQTLPAEVAISAQRQHPNESHLNPRKRMLNRHSISRAPNGLENSSENENFQTIIKPHPFCNLIPHKITPVGRATSPTEGISQAAPCKPRDGTTKEDMVSLFNLTTQAISNIPFLVRLQPAVYYVEAAT